MTTSYETNTTSTGTQPNYNAEGNRVWNPQVGIYHKPAFDEAESYGGIVGALQDFQALNSLLPKAYPHNFAGIIAAIQDLTLSQNTPPVFPGPNPGNGQIIIDIDGNPIFEPTADLPDGSLWFDTRQGKLFVSIDEEWYQTNGADGIPYVTTESTPPAVPQPVPGQFWWDSSQNDLYIFDGLYQTDGGDFTVDPNAGRPVWKLITDGLADAFQNTATLPLAGLGVGQTLTQTIRQGTLWNYINLPDMEFMNVQADYNVWLFESLYELDEAIFNKSSVIIDTVPPVDPKVGDLWFDAESLELSIWYEDDDSSQWVPTSVAYTFDDQVAPLEAKIADEARLREISIQDIYSRIENLRQGSIPDVDALETKVALLEQEVASIPSYNLAPYATSAQLQTAVNDLAREVVDVRSDIPSDYATQLSVAALQSTVNQLPTTADVASSILTAQPDLSNYVTQSHIDQSISNITTEYLPRTGGTLSGSFVVQKEDMSNPAFDFSSEKWYSYNTHKYVTNGPGDHYASFGTNEKAWEYAWDFSSNEDFCWVYADNDKVFSITKDGPACSQLVIGDFLPNDNNDGRVLRNKIDVKERLTTYQLAFENMRQGVANANDFDSLKANIQSALASV